MTLLDDLKRIRRTRWSRLQWPADCACLAKALRGASDSMTGRRALLGYLRDADAALGAETSLIRYTSSVADVLAALLGLAEGTADLSTEDRYHVASEVAQVHVATLKTRDSNLLLDGFARFLEAEHTPAASEDTQTPLSPTRRRKLEATIRSALVELSAEWGDAAWRQGCDPILAIDRDRRRLRREISYTAGIEYRRIEALTCYQVSSSFRSRRLPPPLQEVDVVFCRTVEVLENAYCHPATISAELCDFDAPAWQDMVRRQLASVIHVNGTPCRPVDRTESDDLVRLRVELPDIDPNGEAALAIRNTYLIPAWSRVYPIKLGNYMCVGPVEMSVTLIDPRAEALDVFAYFSTTSAPPGNDQSASFQGVDVERFLTPPGTSQQTVRLRTTPGSLLWPNGGADFIWRRR